VVIYHTKEVTIDRNGQRKRSCANHRNWNESFVAVGVYSSCL